MNAARPVSCAPYFEDSVAAGDLELRVYRCDWGWCVMRGSHAARSRYLDAAFEEALGHAPTSHEMRLLIEMLDRELTAKRDATGATASTTIDAALIEQPRVAV